MKVRVLIAGAIAFFFLASVALAQTESENAKTIAELNKALEAQKVISSNLVNRLENLENQPPPQAGGLTRGEILKILEKDAVQYKGPTHKMLVCAFLTIAFQGTDLEGKEEAVEKEYLRLLEAKKSKEGNDFFLKAVAVAMAKKDKGKDSSSKESSSPPVGPSKDYDSEVSGLKTGLASTNKKIEILDELGKREDERNDRTISELNDRLQNVERDLKTATNAAKDNFAKYGKELESANSAIEKKANKDEINLAIQDWQKWQKEVGGDLWTLADSMNALSKNQNGGMRTRTVPVIGIAASFLGHREPVELTKDGEKLAAKIEKSALEIMERWGKYKK